MRTIEVFKTDVGDHSKAKMILEEIRLLLPNSDPSFDLEDCDNVLRIEDTSGVDNPKVEEILKNHGFHMSTLL